MAFVLLDSTRESTPWWGSSMRHLVVLLLLLVPAEAHLGNENNTEARLYSDSMRWSSGHRSFSLGPCWVTTRPR